MKWIKYIKKMHFDALKTCDSIRIGTLKDFKEGEHGQMVADSMEGVKRFSGEYENVTSEFIKPSHTLSSIVSLGDGIVISSLKMNDVEIIEPDFYIFSFAQDYSLNNHEDWFKKEGYDVAYSINFPSTFFRKVTRELNKYSTVQFLGVFEVHYYDEKKGMDFFDPLNAHPAFCLKDYDGFSTQREFRAVWQPLASQAISPIILNVNGLGRYVALESLIPCTQ